MKPVFKRILYGGDYNPNQWPREVWDQDMAYFKDAKINSATINVFSWAKIQPSEEEYCFQELDHMVDMLSRENFDIVLATSTAALPAWMFRKYPEVARTDYQGRRHVFGKRHNACPNSPVYQKYAKALAGALARRYGSNPHVACWHINNEYGGYCYCDNCAKAFRVWLKRKYRTLDALNAAWNLEFWGHTVYSWEEVVPPNLLGDGMENGEDTAFAGLSVDYRRFQSDSLLANFIMERDAVRAFSPNTPITTNLMGTYKELDYFKWAKEMDLISWDNYPSYDTPASYTAMCHDLMRGLKDQPFMLMEQTPSQQNWQPYNSLKRPGQMRAQSYQAMAHGADTVQFFQLRRSRGGCEKFHGAVIAHAGTGETRVFREVTRLGEELERLSAVIPGSRNEAQVGILFDWDNYWALEYTSGPTRDLAYVDQIHRYYRYFYEKNISVSMIPWDADFRRYQMIVAPVLYMVKEGMPQALEEFVAEGGVLVTTFMSGIVDQSDNVHLGGYPGPLRRLAGVWVEEMDALAPTQGNTVVFADGNEFACGLLCDLMHLEGARCLASYKSDFYAGTPAVTKHQFGSGQVYYLGTALDPAGLANVLDMAVSDASVDPVISTPTRLEVLCRRGRDCAYYFVMNFSETPQPVPPCFQGRTDLLTGRTAEADALMAPYDVKIIAEKYTDR